MYTRHEFYVALQNEVSEITGKDVELIEALKANDVVYHGLSIATGERLCPVLYVDHYYFEDIGSADISLIAADVSEQLLSLPDRNTESWVQNFTDNVYECAKNVQLHIINRERSCKFLENLPNRQFLDLAIYCVIPLHYGTATVKVTYSLLNHLKLSEDELFETALKNTCKDCVAAPLSKIINTLLCEHSVDFEPVDDDLDLLVLTTHSKIHGASLIACPSVLENIGKMYGSYYILPSSVHECILVTNLQNEAYHLLEMVKQVNATQVADCEYLSDAVYYYDAERKEISIAAK